MQCIADLILYNGRFYTVDKTQPWAEAVAVAGSFIVVVGNNEDVLALAGPQTRRVDLGGRLALPGLCDAHIHLYDWSVARQQVLLAGCADKAEMLARIREAAGRQPPPAWVSGRGWNESFWTERVLPTRADLDQVTGPEQPAIFWRSDMHAAVANSAALQRAGITMATPDPPGGIIGRDGSGRPNGLLWELAINLVMAAMPTPEDSFLDEAISAGIAELHRLGVTAVHDQRMKDQTEGPLALAAYQRLRRAGRLKLRLNCNVAAHDLPHLAGLGLGSGFGDNRLRLGHVKFFTDGSMGSQTAWMLQPYEKEEPAAPDSAGINVTPPEQLAAGFRQAETLGFPVSVHAIGDRANRVVLDIFEELAQSGPRLAIPHRIEHVQIIDPADLPRLAALGLTASVQPIHATDDMDTADRVLGLRASRVYNFRSLAESGALLAFGSDAPVADPNPFLGFHAALCRQRPERMAAGPWYGQERLALTQVIEGYTLGAAQAAGWEAVIGSLTPGKRADLIVLDRDLFALEKAGISGREVADTQVLLTLFDGEVVYSQALHRE